MIGRRPTSRTAQVSSLLDFILGALATYRLTRMISSTEEGPYGVLDKFRAHTGVTNDFGYLHLEDDNELGKMVMCPFCTSVWVGLAFAIGFWLFPRPTRFIATALGMSGAGAAISRLVD